jgi:hypothetical protein
MKGTPVRIRIVTFALGIPAENYVQHATHLAPEFSSWPGLQAKWWLGDTGSGTYGGVYLFATREDADLSRETELFRGMSTNPAFRDVTVREYDLLDAPTAISAPLLQQAS